VLEWNKYKVSILWGGVWEGILGCGLELKEKWYHHLGFQSDLASL
jgi:hypothetical protein